MNIITDIITKNQSIKGLLLVIISSIFFYILCIGYISSSPFYAAMVMPFDIASDDICLLLMFNEYNNIYNCLCKFCNNCCIKVVFGKSYDHQSLNMIINDDDDTDNNVSETYL